MRLHASRAHGNMRHGPPAVCSAPAYSYRLLTVVNVSTIIAFSMATFDSSVTYCLKHWCSKLPPRLADLPSMLPGCGSTRVYQD